MDRITTKNGMGENVLCSPIICSKCGEADWSPVMENGERVTDHIANYEGKIDSFAKKGTGLRKYVRQEDVISRFQKIKDKCESLRDAIYLDGVMAVLDTLPAVDVAEVRHGHWIWNPHHCKWECSECGGMEGECESPICKWCGAHMDEKGIGRT